MNQQFEVGSLVRVREREWIVRTNDSDEFLTLRPATGERGNIAGVVTSLEKVSPAVMKPPKVDSAGKFAHLRLLEEAFRFGNRYPAGPLRSFGRLKFDPRPYQLVPLLAAFSADPIRILIGDDLGIGKTIEAAFIARELLDRREISRFAVLAPASLVGQWINELQSKFAIAATAVLPSTIASLEKDCRMGESLFSRYPFLVVSMDYVRKSRAGTEFLKHCPELVIVDEAHLLAGSFSPKQKQSAGKRLLQNLAADPDRHIILLTAAPDQNPGDTHPFALRLILPESGNQPEASPAGVFIRRSREQIRQFLETETFFPAKTNSTIVYRFSPAYKRILRLVLRDIRKTFSLTESSKPENRLHWYFLLGILRCLSSSPLATNKTLRNFPLLDGEATYVQEDFSRKILFDLAEDYGAENLELFSGLAPDSDIARKKRQRYLWLARQTQALDVREDNKLKSLARHIEKMADIGSAPVVFCRLASTTDYLEKNLPLFFRKPVHTVSVTGRHFPDEISQRLALLKTYDRRALICTDCLGEGINLQDSFDCVIHYDISWNPFRHDQREARTDRFGQPKDTVRSFVCYSPDNIIDEVVLDLLIRKYHCIYQDTGRPVPPPGDADMVLEAMLETVVRRKSPMDARQRMLPGFEACESPRKHKFHKSWQDRAKRIKQSEKCNSFAKNYEAETKELYQQIESSSGLHSRDFAEYAVRQLSAENIPLHPESKCFSLFSKNGLHFREEEEKTSSSRVFPPRKILRQKRTLDRRHAVEISEIIKRLAFSGKGVYRFGAVFSPIVSRKTICLLVRFRFVMIKTHNGRDQYFTMEETRPVAFETENQKPVMSDMKTVQNLPDRENETPGFPDVSCQHLKDIAGMWNDFQPLLEKKASERAQKALSRHRSIRKGKKESAAVYRIKPMLPADIIGIFAIAPLEKATNAMVSP